MKNLALLSFALLAVSGGLEAGGIIQAPIRETYIPTGFDDNDIPQIVVEVEVPDTSYQVARLNRIINHDRKEVVISVFAFPVRERGIPVQNLKMVVVDLPEPLQQGNYTVKESFERLPELGGFQKDLGVISISAPKNRRDTSADDFDYAPVDSVILKQDDQDRRFLTLFGAFTNSCLRLKGVPQLIHVDPKVMIVLPIVEKIENQECQMGHFEFSVDVPVVPNIEHGKHLIHVRVPEGSYNKIIMLR